jgi:IclR family acetate operon transcriptional repressor
VKAVRILHAVAKEPAAVSLADLSATVRLPKPTAHRLMSELERLRLVSRDPLTRRYRVGPDLEDLAVEAMRNAIAQSGRRLHMERLAEKIGERINIGVMSAGKVIYVEWVESAGPLRVNIAPGTQVPAHCSANGKLLLAYGPASLRQRILAASPAVAYTANTITAADALARELENIRRQGYSEDNEEFLAGVCCLAVPVRNRRGEVVAGLAVMAPSARLPLEKARQHLPDLRTCAEAISAELHPKRRRDSRNGLSRGGMSRSTHKPRRTR